jgi:hypothetical protein
MTTLTLALSPFASPLILLAVRIVAIEVRSAIGA